MLKFLFSLALFFLSYTGLFADTVTFRGISHDPKMGSLTIVDFPPITHTNPSHGVTLAKANRDAENRLSLRFHLDSERILQFKMIGRTLSLPVYPGDSIQFEIAADKKITFSGKRSATYNYLAQVNQTESLKGNFYFKLGDDLAAYHAQIKTWFERRMNFLKQYGKEHSLPRDYIDAEQSEIYSQMQSLLLAPLISGVKRNDLPAVYQADMQPIYIDEISGPYSRYAMRQLYLQDQLNYKEGKGELFGDYQSGVPDQKKVLALSNLIGYYTATAKDQYQSELEGAISYAREHAEDPLWFKYLDRLAQDFQLLKNTFPQNILQQASLLRLSDSTEISLVDLLKAHEGSPIYIDFWASWCSPCIENIRNAKEVKAYLKEINVPIVYISVDENQAKWVASAKKEQIEENQYLLKDDTSSPLAKFLGVRAIPRYIILDSKHRVVDDNAPGPIPSAMKNLQAIFNKMEEDKKAAPKIIAY